MPTGPSGSGQVARKTLVGGLGGAQIGRLKVELDWLKRKHELVDR